MTDLPDWVLQLVYELNRAEDEHPTFYALTTDAKYERTDCYLRSLLELVPPAVLSGVEMAERWTPVTNCRDCGHNLRHHVNPGGCCIGECPCPCHPLAEEAS